MVEESKEEINDSRISASTESPRFESPSPWSSRAYKTIGEHYSYYGVYLGFNKTLGDKSQMVIERDFEKVRIFWLLRGIKNAKKRSEKMYNQLTNSIDREEAH